MTTQRTAHSIVDQCGGLAPDIADVWRSGRYEVWSDPFNAWIRDPGPTISIRPGESAASCAADFANDCGYRSAEVRMVIPTF